MDSQIKQTSLELLRIIDGLAQANIKSGIVRSFWNRFFVSHATKIISGKPDAELKLALDLAYKTLRPIFETKQVNAELIEARKLNDSKMNVLVKNLPQFRKQLELELDEII